MSNFVGEIRIFSYGVVPNGWAQCNGQLLLISDYNTLFTLFGNTYGGNNTTNFALPDLRGRVAMHIGNTHIIGEKSGQERHTLSILELPAHSHSIVDSEHDANTNDPNYLQGLTHYNIYSTISKNDQYLDITGGDQSHQNIQPILALNFCIALQGIIPNNGSVETFIAEIRIFAFNFPPSGWAQCNGQLMSITQNTALFSLVGTYYGGNGKTNFALPNLKGRIPLQTGQGVGLADYPLAGSGGIDSVSLLESEMPSHSHTYSINQSDDPNTNYPTAINASTNFAISAKNIYSTNTQTTTFKQGSYTGNNQPHNNLQPYLTLNYCIALTGIFPPRD